MKKTALATTALLLLGVSSAFAQTNVLGGSSNTNYVRVAGSNFPGDAPAGYAGISMVRPGTSPEVWSGYVNIAAAPIQQATTFATTANVNGPFWATMPGTSTTIAQVWRTDSTYNATADIFSLRQVINPAVPMPAFGGLVIGRVNGTALGNGVYFGEWAPQGTLTTAPSTDLNMDDSRRTVWYVGDNAVSSTPQLVNVTYSVAGIQQTGVGTGNTPYAPDLYNGTLTANYANSGSANQISGSLSNSGNSVSINAAILNDGRFISATTQGRFYNGATALAGIYTGSSGAADDIAYGGHQTGGSINPLP